MQEILSVEDPLFAQYGAVWADVDHEVTSRIAQTLEYQTTLPEGCEYVAEARYPGACRRAAACAHPLWRP